MFNKNIFIVLIITLTTLIVGIYLVINETPDPLAQSKLEHQLQELKIKTDTIEKSSLPLKYDKYKTQIDNHIQNIKQQCDTEANNNRTKATNLNSSIREKETKISDLESEIIYLKIDKENLTNDSPNRSEINRITKEIKTKEKNLSLLNKQLTEKQAEQEKFQKLTQQYEALSGECEPLTLSQNITRDNPFKIPAFDQLYQALTQPTIQTIEKMNQFSTKDLIKTWSAAKGLHTITQDIKTSLTQIKKLKEKQSAIQIPILNYQNLTWFQTQKTKLTAEITNLQAELKTSDQAELKTQIDNRQQLLIDFDYCLHKLKNLTHPFYSVCLQTISHPKLEFLVGKDNNYLKVSQLVNNIKNKASEIISADPDLQDEKTGEKWLAAMFNYWQLKPSPLRLTNFSDTSAPKN